MSSSTTYALPLDNFRERTVQAESVPPARSMVAMAFAAVYVIWGSTYLAIRFAEAGLPPFLLSGVRHSLAGIALFAWARWRGAPAPTRTQWNAASIVGALLLCGGNGGVVYAETRIPSGITAVMVATVPLWIIVINWLRPGGRRPALLVLGGLLLGFAGTCLLANPSSGTPAFDGVGIFAVAFASFCWAAGSVYAKRARLPANALLATGMEMLAGGALLVFLGGVCGEAHGWHAANVPTTAWVALAYLIVFGSLVGFTAYSWLLKVAPTDKVATYAYVNPVIALGLGAMLGGEELSMRTVMAAAVVLVGVAFIIKNKTVDQNA